MPSNCCFKGKAAHRIKKSYCGRPSRQTHTHIDRGLTGEDSSTHRPHDAHEEDGYGHESGHLVLSQRGKGQQGSRQVEDQRGDGRPQKHSIPHLCRNTPSYTHQSVDPTVQIIHSSTQCIGAIKWNKSFIIHLSKCDSDCLA